MLSRESCCKLLVGLVLVGGIGDAEDVINLGSRRELMLDGFLFSSTRRLSFRQHQPVERKQVLDFSAPWEGRKYFGFSVT
ncbi:MAG: hypothetical protein VB859_12675, partial [Planctomycetaceae bacterium]